MNVESHSRWDSWRYRRICPVDNVSRDRRFSSYIHAQIYVFFSRVCRVFEQTAGVKCLCFPYRVRSYTPASSAGKKTRHRRENDVPLFRVHARRPVWVASALQKCKRHCHERFNTSQRAKLASAGVASRRVAPVSCHVTNEGNVGTSSDSVPMAKYLFIRLFTFECNNIRCKGVTLPRKFSQFAQTKLNCLLI